MTAFPLHAQSPEVVEAFVTRHYFHGIPYAEAEALGSEAVPTLVSMLDDPAYEAFWPNVVGTLGIVGDAAAVPALTGFLERQQGEISPSALRAVLGVLPALGLIARSGDAEVIALLESQARAPTPRFTVDYGQGAYRGNVLRSRIQRSALTGLAWSGHPDAGAALRRLDDQLQKRGDVAPHVVKGLGRSRDLHARIRDEGHVAVFGDG